MSTSATDDIIRVACWNVEHNGRAGKRGARDRRAIAHDILASLQPHIVLRQELTSAHADGKRALYEEASRIGGLTAFMAPATAESPNPTGVMFDPRLFETVAYYEHTTAVWHPVCNPVVRLKGATKDLSLASIHLSSWDPLKRASEARRLTVLADQGRSAIFGGDLNSYPHRTADEAVPLPDWGQVTDVGHYERRTVERDGRRVADTIPDEIFTGRGLFMELGHYAAHTLDPPQPDALKPTASLWKTGQGHRSRIDRLYCTPDLAPALRRLEVIDSDEVRTASDHALIVAEFSRSALHMALITAA